MVWVREPQNLVRFASPEDQLSPTLIYVEPQYRFLEMRWKKVDQKPPTIISLENRESVVFQVCGRFTLTTSHSPPSPRADGLERRFLMYLPGNSVLTQ